MLITLKNLENLENSWNLLILENSGKFWEFGIYSGNSCISDVIFFVTRSVTHSKLTCKFAWLQWYLCELLVVVYRISVDKKGTEMTAKVILYLGF